MTFSRRYIGGIAREETEGGGKARVHGGRLLQPFRQFLKLRGAADIVGVGDLLQRRPDFAGDDGGLDASAEDLGQVVERRLFIEHHGRADEVALQRQVLEILQPVGFPGAEVAFQQQARRLFPFVPAHAPLPPAAR